MPRLLSRPSGPRMGASTCRRPGKHWQYHIPGAVVLPFRESDTGKGEIRTKKKTTSSVFRGSAPYKKRKPRIKKLLVRKTTEDKAGPLVGRGAVTQGRGKKAARHGGRAPPCSVGPPVPRRRGAPTLCDGGRDLFRRDVLSRSVSRSRWPSSAIYVVDAYADMGACGGAEEQKQERHGRRLARPRASRGSSASPTVSDALFFLCRSPLCGSGGGLSSCAYRSSAAKGFAEGGEIAPHPPSFPPSPRLIDVWKRGAADSFEGSRVPWLPIS